MKNKTILGKHRQSPMNQSEAIRELENQIERDFLRLQMPSEVADTDYDEPSITQSRLNRNIEILSERERDDDE